jgi:hypothetical protein
VKWGGCRGSDARHASPDPESTGCAHLPSRNDLLCRRVAAMRCMSCGDNMILAEAFPAETGLARGFENQNLQCPGCGTTERRFVFAACATSFSGQAPKKATAQSNLHPVGKSNGASGVPAFQDLRISIFDVLAEEKTSASALQSQVGDSLTENVTRAFGRPRTRQEIRAPEASCPSSKPLGAGC